MQALDKQKSTVEQVKKSLKQTSTGRCKITFIYPDGSEDGMIFPDKERFKSEKEITDNIPEGYTKTKIESSSDNKTVRVFLELQSWEIKLVLGKTVAEEKIVFKPEYNCSENDVIEYVKKKYWKTNAYGDVSDYEFSLEQNTKEG